MPRLDNDALPTETAGAQVAPVAALSIVVLQGLTDPNETGRFAVFVFVLVVWALQLAWSKAWLERFRFGPAEWAWRSMTYRKLQPLRR